YVLQAQPYLICPFLVLLSKSGIGRINVHSIEKLCTRGRAQRTLIVIGKTGGGIVHVGLKGPGLQSCLYFGNGIYGVYIIQIGGSLVPFGIHKIHIIGEKYISLRSKCGILVVRKFVVIYFQLQIMPFFFKIMFIIKIVLLAQVFVKGV